MLSRREIIKRLSLTGATLSLSGLSAPSSAAVADVHNKAFWNRVRKQFMLDNDSVFFNPGTVGAMPRVVVERMTAHLTGLATNVAQWAYKDDNQEQYISGYNNLLPIRRKVARLLNCTPGEIAMTDNVTNGMSYLANGLDLNPGDEVLSTNQEHGGGRSCWMLLEKRKGTTYREMELPKPIKDRKQVLDLVVKSFSEKTRVLMLSHIITGSGAILPVKEICDEARKRGIITILDGAQAIGQIKVDLTEIGCDAYVGCFHKWIGAPCGTGFMYIRNELMPRVWSTVASSTWDKHEDEGYRFTQRGTGSFSVLMGLEAALDFHFELGPDLVYNRIKFLGQRLRDGLRATPNIKIFSPEDEGMCAGITVYTVNGWSGVKLQDTFWERERMRPRSMGPVFGLRQCTHIFHSDYEIDRSLALTSQLAKEMPQS
jgi:isopenicillin-N epimerase